MSEPSVKLSEVEWIHIIERVEDDDFYYADLIAQTAIIRIKKQLSEFTTKSEESE